MKLYYDDVNTITVVDGNTDMILINGITHDVVNGKIHTKELDISKHNTYQAGEFTGSVENRFIVKTSYFDEHYTDSKAILGSKVMDNKTIFRLWAPTAYKVNLVLDDVTLQMNRLEKGIYELQMDENLAGISYLYEIHRDGKIITTCDPYAKATLPNRKASVVSDLTFEKVAVESKSDVILEMHVRDFSMDLAVPFKNRGQFLGMLESYGNYGYQHVKDLGVGVLQLQPVTDFETVDELNPLSGYNWGYDPMQFFALEGSYSSNVHDPLQVLRDFSTLVNQYHQDGFKVTMDVVYNHIYEVEGSSLNDVLPYYYFRYVDGKLSDGTYCGNEIASEYTMVSKFILDACVYFVEQFDIDGYRFDLMGITDIDTMNSIRDALIVIKPDIMLYGEGWNMACGLPEDQRACMQNHQDLPGYAYFNDLFRNTVGGDLSGSDIGILNPEHQDLIQDVINGSPSIFCTPEQSINYVECHDNYAMADKLSIMGLGLDEAKIYIEATIRSQGHPFLQIGQSFYRNKKGVENSYKSLDEINRIEWSYLDKYSDLNAFTSNLIKARSSNKNQSLKWDLNTKEFNNIM